MDIFTEANGDYSTAMEDIRVENHSTAIGWYSQAEGKASLAMGFVTKAKSYAETVILSNTDYTASNSDSWNDNEGFLL